jgi:plasmid stabilization system protein ParE
VRRLIYAHRAKEDIADIEGYWRDRDDLIVGFYRALRDATDFLLDTPGGGTPVEGSNRRKWKVGRTPFLIIYRATHAELRVLRVVHQSQNWRPLL